jgi:CheY-like chemotaxis protein
VQPIDCVLLGARRASELTRQLLAYAGKGPFEVKAIDLSAHVRELATLLETTIPKKVQLRLEVAKGLPAVEADVAQMQQIVMNLVVNAAEAIGDERGTVLVTTGVQEIDAPYAATLYTPTDLPGGTYVFLEVHDTGVGMDDATLGRIFDPFFTTKFTGRGLGLAAVLGIVRAHKGALKVYSQPGKGTTFRIFFPASERAVAQGRGESVDAFRGTGSILVIDDDPGVRSALRMLLDHYGFEVVEAPDGRSGLQAFAAHAGDFVVVILDMTMPDLGGEETFRELRAIREDVPVILASGYNEVEATRRFAAKGLAGFLSKPFTAAELVSKLRAAVDTRGSGRHPIG